MSSCCDICVDPTCDGKKNCNCDTCDKKDKCYRFAGLKPTIRITTKCTQSCSHCCFECSPKGADMMSLEMAGNINTFMHKNNIRHMEVMGGEFFCHPQWEEIIDILVKGMLTVRLVSTGDWAGASNLSERVVGFLRAHPQIRVGLSKDQWHTNKHVDAASQALKNGKIPFRLPTEDEIKEDSIVPIGRGEFHYGFYSMFGNYCNKPDRRYVFLIDEKGAIYKCGLGGWPYANVTEYLDGGFNARFKYFNDKFYGAHVMTCSQCRRAESYAKSEKD